MNDDPQFDWQRPDFRQFDFGLVISRAFGGIRDRFTDIAFLGFFFIWLPGLIIASTDYWVELEIPFVVLALFIGLIFAVIALVQFQAAMIMIMVQQFWFDPMDVRTSLTVARSRFWPLVGVSILAVLAIILGFILLIIPAIILYCGWYVLAVIVVGEQKSVMESFGRSWDLTRGYKWQIFGLFVVTVLMAGFIGGILGAIGGLFAGLEAVEMVPEADPLDVLLFSAFQSLASMIGTILSIAVIASTYVELIRVKGEYDPYSEPT